MTTALSPREREVLVELALNGGTDAQIAQRLGMAPNTVRTHMQHLRTKTGAHTRLELAVLVWRAQGQNRNVALHGLPGSPTGSLRGG